MEKFLYFYLFLFLLANLIQSNDSFSISNEKNQIDRKEDTHVIKEKRRKTVNNLGIKLENSNDHSKKSSIFY